jgi:hypothetical protein
MPPGHLEKLGQNALRTFVDAVQALSDAPSKANVDRYLAESAALEGHRPSARTPPERSADVRPLPHSPL